MVSEKTNDSAGAGTRPPAREPRNAGISRDGTAKLQRELVGVALLIANRFINT